MIVAFLGHGQAQMTNHAEPRKSNAVKIGFCMDALRIFVKETFNVFIL